MHFGVTGCFGGLDGLSLDERVSVLQEAERLGYESIWLNEEHFAAEGRACLAPLPLASYLAGRTERLRLGFSVLQLPVHDPLRLAEDLATLDVLSGGRVDVGVSRSGNARYHRGFGVPIEERTERFTEALACLQTFWTAEEPVTHHGTYYHFEDVLLTPKPVQRPHPPIYVGARDPESVRRVAAGGYRLIEGVIQALSYTQTDVAAFRAAAAEVGRPIGPDDLTIGRFVFVTKTAAQAAEEAPAVVAGLAQSFRRSGLLQRGFVVDPDQLAPEKVADELAIVGTPEACAARIADLRQQLGFGRFNCAFGFSGFASPAQVRRSLRLFGTRVIPQFHRA